MSLLLEPESPVMLKLIALFVLLPVLGGMLYVRLAPSDPALWHADPLLAERPQTPNFHLIRPVGGNASAPIYLMRPAALAAAIDRVARADGAELVIGSVEDGHMTYVSRSAFMGFPDYTSIKVLPAGEGATFAAFARARFGNSDLGVNRRRLERWLHALAAQPAERS